MPRLHPVEVHLEADRRRHAPHDVEDALAVELGEVHVEVWLQSVCRRPRAICAASSHSAALVSAPLGGHRVEGIMPMRTNGCPRLQSARSCRGAGDVVTRGERPGLRATGGRRPRARVRIPRSSADVLSVIGFCEDLHGIGPQSSPLLHGEHASAATYLQLHHRDAECCHVCTSFPLSGWSGDTPPAVRAASAITSDRVSNVPSASMACSARQVRSCRSSRGRTSSTVHAKVEALARRTPLIAVRPARRGRPSSDVEGEVLHHGGVLSPKPTRRPSSSVEMSSVVSTCHEELHDLLHARCSR
jgi:hypothetical protein